MRVFVLPSRLKDCILHWLSVVMYFPFYASNYDKCAQKDHSLVGGDMLLSKTDMTYSLFCKTHKNVKKWRTSVFVSPEGNESN